MTQKNIIPCMTYATAFISGNKEKIARNTSFGGGGGKNHLLKVLGSVFNADYSAWVQGHVQGLLYYIANVQVRKIPSGMGGLASYT